MVGTHGHLPALHRCLIAARQRCSPRRFPPFVPEPDRLRSLFVVLPCCWAHGPLRGGSFRRGRDHVDCCRLRSEVRVWQETGTEQEYPCAPFGRRDLQRFESGVFRAEHPAAVTCRFDMKGVIPASFDHAIDFRLDFPILPAWQAMPVRLVGIEAQHAGQLGASNGSE